MGFRDHPFAYNPRGKIQDLLGFKDFAGNGPLYLPVLQEIHHLRGHNGLDFVDFASGKINYDDPATQLPAVHVKFGPSTLSEKTIQAGPVLEERFNVTITVYVDGFVDSDTGQYTSFKSFQRGLLERFLGGIQHIINFNLANGVYSLSRVTTEPDILPVSTTDLNDRSSFTVHCPGYLEEELRGLEINFDTHEGIFVKVQEHESDSARLKLVAFQQGANWKFYLLKKYRGIGSIQSGVSAFPTNLSYNVDTESSDVGIYGNVDIIYSVISYFRY